MVPTLETPMVAGKSVVWCGAFQLAWNHLKLDVLHEPIRIQGAEALSTTLNTSPFTDSDLTPDSFYAAAGLAKEGILDRIRREMGTRFPGVSPTLPEVPELAAMAYAYLAAGVRFKYAYRQHAEGVQFRAGSGAAKTVRAFGINPADAHAFRDLVGQPRILYHGSANPVEECLIDLDPTSTPHQVVLALMKRPSSMLEALSWVDQKSAEQKSIPFQGGETLLIPEIAIGMLHHFGELEGPDKVVLNQVLHGAFIGDARQAIQFRLSRGGAELRAEAGIAVAAAAPPTQTKPLEIIFDRPFLFLMKKREANRPFLAVWIENAEVLLTP